MSIFKRSPEAEAKYQARLAEIRAKREERLSRIHGDPLEVKKHLDDNVTKIKAEYADDKANRRAQADRDKEERKSKWANHKEEQAESKASRSEKLAKLSAKRMAVKAEKQASKAAVVEARGIELGYVSISYVGGFDNKRRYSAKLHFFEKQIEYSQLGRLVEGLMITASDVVSIQITGQQQTTSRLSVTRMATLGVFSLAAPKRTKVKDANLIIGLKDGREVLFHTKMYTEFEVHSKLANAISYYKSLQVSQANHAESVIQASQTDNATEIMKYAILYKKGAITAEEYQAKKRQLLGL